jgi:NAD(P)-dependent dehydrogenase (short-subunit alcohol dehydrogenase family)
MDVKPESTIGNVAIHVVITGGCGDIGLGIARRLIGGGARITLLDIFPQEKGEKAATTIAAAPACTYIHCDVTCKAQVDAVFGSSAGRIDVVICNAGIVRADRFVDIKEDDWLYSLSVNLTGGFYTAQAAAKFMLKQDRDAHGIRGRILFTGSWVQDMPFPGSGSYIVSKGGLKMLAKVMAQELASSGIRVNTVAPGLVMAGLTKQLYDRDPDFRSVATKAIPIEEFQSIESVAASFAFLCSHDSDYMTGATVLIDGGCSLVRRDQ